MSRKHKSHRKQKITQSNAPAPFATAKKQAATPAPTQPENTAPAMDNVVAANTLPETETAPETASPATPINHLENEVEVAENHNTPANEDTVYSLDAHYDAQQANASVAASLNTENAATTDTAPDTPSAAPADSGSSTTENVAVSLNEYEQLKRKNRRRLVGAGALVLVAGSLFAAASKDNVQNTPQLNPVKPVEQVQTEILRPAGSENKIDLSMDNEKAAPLVLKNNSVAPPLPQQNKAKPTTMAAAPTVSKPTPSVSKPSAQSSEERAKAREEARAAEERRQKAQSKAAEAEAKRLEAERAVANKARAAQAAADRNRNAERAQLTAERAAEEKQRAQRQAQVATANSNKANNNNNKSSSGGKSSIQAGAFADKEAARRMQQQLKDLNYAARLEEVQTSKGKMYRVRTGNFSNESEARSALNKLQNKGVNGMVVGK
ncbi:SPOR domain-containing protein [Alysiella filiformis]|uniref:Cell division protein FtsN n=1 Tax=Alysiella filiformis DSM 16848 TaxID=1120981 RepID=A0A286ECD5_9NEIS|nr:SPOR domain-containing protein [Alysiella filiformis]QMT30615.1 SPOR domain-containing protein [Alysiella filiformis]UBQ56407.1 SPOR domain-containing protein [Alysiella filiformis DSM 16848]SOD68494.1 Cell division protein FtsN [Alysiella filiformis DSM 16848]